MSRRLLKRCLAFVAALALVFGVIALSPPTPSAGATAPGANGRIAFERMGPPFIPSGDIYTINPNGSGIQRLTFGGTGMFPAWSPDGRRIAYAGPAPYAFAIWIMNANGSSPHQLTHPGRSEDLRPAWSPNGKRIAFDRLFGSTTVMWIMNADGTGATRLHRGTEPSWSPNGRWIAFTGPRGIWVIRPNGRRAHQVTPGMAEHPSWSPNGKRLAFSLFASGAGASGNWDIWVLNLSSSGLRHVTQSKASERMPVWSPDGSRIAFSRSYRAPDGGTLAAIWTIRADGTGARHVTRHANRIDWNADWQPLPR